MARHLNSTDLARLVADDEIETVCKLLKLDQKGAVISRSMFIEQISRISRTKLLWAIVSINGAWIGMIRDISNFLQLHCASLRTTGCLITVSGTADRTKLNLTPQVLESIAIFNSESYKDRYLNSCCLLHASPSPRDQRGSRMPCSA